jgi:lysophospholipase L1-like esterase
MTAMVPKSRRLLVLKLLLPLFGLLVGLVLAEVGLRLIEGVQSREQEAFSEKVLLEDPKLHRRIAPNAPGHDANGFRNDAVPANAEIVALGDSQTWGINGQRSEAWPQVLGKISKRTVYNMGVGGYGPLHYSALTEKALSLSPKVIVVGIYLGNDLYDAYSLAYSSDVYKDLREPGASADLLRDTIAPRANALWDEEKNFQHDFGRGEPRLGILWLSGHTAVGRLMARSGWWPGSSDVWFEASKAWAKAHPEHGAVYDAGGVRTVLTTAYRLTALDLDDPHIAEGLRLTGVALQRIKGQTDTANVKVLVVLIPTKESVFAGALENRQRDPVYERLYSMESRTRAALIAQCKNANIEYVDALPPLVQAVRDGEQQVYPTSTESHPTPKGYQVIAFTVYDALKHLAW